MTQDQAIPDRLTTEIYQLRFSVEKALRYHHRRQAFFETAHRWIMFIIILLGSAAFAKPLGHPEWFGVAAAVLAALDLVWGLSHKARDHQMFRASFSDLASEMELCGESANDENQRQWKTRRIEIEADEPPTFWAVDQDCHNEVSVAWEHNDFYRPLSWRKRIFKNIFRFDQVDPPQAVPA